MFGTSPKIDLSMAMCVLSDSNIRFVAFQNIHNIHSIFCSDLFFFPLSHECIDGESNEFCSFSVSWDTEKMILGKDFSTLILVPSEFVVPSLWFS